MKGQFYSLKINILTKFIYLDEQYNNFRYLEIKYSCILIKIEETYNTLFTIKNVLDKFKNTYVIECDVVINKDILLCNSENSFYYVMSYTNCEKDAWCPIIKNNRIKGFKIGSFKEPCIFGISFWKANDCKILVDEIKKHLTLENYYNKDIFWDDCIINILDKINLKVHNINSNDAYEMNNKAEYEFVKHQIEKYYRNCSKFLINYKKENELGLRFISNKQMCKKWHQKFLEYYNKQKHYFPLILNENNKKIFNKGEYPFMIWSSTFNNYVGYFDIAEAENYFLLRRIFIEEKYQKNGIGKYVVSSLKLYAQLVNKEMRVNVYDKKAELFYKTNDLKLYFKTYKY